MTNPPQSLAFKSYSPRFDQWQTGTNVILYLRLFCVYIVTGAIQSNSYLLLFLGKQS